MTTPHPEQNHHDCTVPDLDEAGDQWTCPTCGDTWVTTSNPEGLRWYRITR